MLENSALLNVFILQLDPKLMRFFSESQNLSIQSFNFGLSVMYRIFPFLYHTFLLAHQRTNPLNLRSHILQLFLMFFDQIFLIIEQHLPLLQLLLILVKLVSHLLVFLFQLLLTLLHQQHVLFYLSFLLLGLFQVHLHLVQLYLHTLDDLVLPCQHGLLVLVLLTKLLVTFLHVSQLRAFYDHLLDLLQHHLESNLVPAWDTLFC